MAFQAAGALHSPHKGIEDRHLDIVRPVVEDIEDAGGQLEYRDVVDVFADVAPGMAQPGNPLSQRFADRQNVLVGGGETVLEGERVEKHQTADAQGGGTVLLLVGAGDDVGDATRRAGVLAGLLRRLFQRVADRSRSGGNSVPTFEFQRKSMQLLGDIRDGPGSDLPLRLGSPATTVHPPLEVGRGLKLGARVLRVAEPAGVENADEPKSVREAVQAVVELTSQIAVRSLPLALQDDEVSGSQFGPDVRDALAAAALGPGPDAAVTEQLGEQDIGAFLAGRLGIVTSSGHLRNLDSPDGGKCKRPPDDGRFAEVGLAMAYFPQGVAPRVSSALRRFTSVFGMGTGGATAL